MFLSQSYESHQGEILEARPESIQAWEGRFVVKEGGTSPMRRRASLLARKSVGGNTHGVVPFGGAASNANRRAAADTQPRAFLQTPLVEVLSLPHQLHAPTAPLPQSAVSLKQLLHHEISTLNPGSIGAVEAKLSSFHSLLSSEQFDHLFLNILPPAPQPTFNAPKDIINHDGEPTTFLNCSSVTPTSGPGRRRCSRKALHWDTTHHAIPMSDVSLDPTAEAESESFNQPSDLPIPSDRHGDSRYFHRKGGKQDMDSTHPLEPRREMHANRLKSQTTSFTLDGTDVGTSKEAVDEHSAANSWITPSVTKARVPSQREPRQIDQVPNRHKSQRVLRESILAHKGYANVDHVITAPPGHKYDKASLDRVKAKILSRGNGSFASLRRTFRIFNDGKLLNRRDFKEGMELIGTPLSTVEIDVVFRAFDVDGSGGINLTEFLIELRGPLATRRRDLVVEAFKLIDTDGSGVATMDELMQIYGANLHRHPQVMDGSKTPEEVMREFISSWDKNRDGSVTLAEFIEYYTEISASIENGNYFELMIRNAWHMSGGEGEFANTANRRVLVVYNDNRQEVVTIHRDLGVGTGIPSIRAALEKQGVTNIKRIEKAM